MANDDDDNDFSISDRVSISLASSGAITDLYVQALHGETPGERRVAIDKMLSCLHILNVNADAATRIKMIRRLGELA